LNIEGLEALRHQGPIVMVNLMRFFERSLDGDGSGWDAYLRYSALTVLMIKARGGTLLWTRAIDWGDVGSGSDRHDAGWRPSCRRASRVCGKSRPASEAATSWPR
jgi:hypothetical protein